MNKYETRDYTIWGNNFPIYTKYGRVNQKAIEYTNQDGEAVYWYGPNIHVVPQSGANGILWTACVRTSRNWTTVDEVSTGSTCKSFEHAVNNAIKKHNKRYGHNFPEYKA